MNCGVHLRVLFDRAYTLSRVMQAADEDVRLPVLVGLREAVHG